MKPKRFKAYVDQHIGRIDGEVHVLATISTDRNAEDRRDEEIEGLKQNFVNVERAMYGGLQLVSKIQRRNSRFSLGS